MNSPTQDNRSAAGPTSQDAENPATLLRATTQYSDSELTLIRGVIDGSITPTSEQTAASERYFESHPLQNPALNVFKDIQGIDPGLFAKLEKDPIVLSCSFYGLIPASYELIYQNQESIDLSVGTGNRGYSLLFKTNSGTGVVVKPAQSSREIQIAKKAAELEAGPNQLDSIRGFISEVLVQGNPLTRLPEQQRNVTTLRHIGEQFGMTLSRLHKSHIFYNDDSLADDSGRSHVFIGDGDLPTVTLIDYGVAIDLSLLPNLPDDAIYDYIRTLPDFALLQFRYEMTPEFINQLIEQNRDQINNCQPQVFFQRDLNFFTQGCFFLQTRLNLNQTLADALVSGFKATYSVE